MNVAVLGLGHLGTVTAAGLAALGHRVIGFDSDARQVDRLSAGCSPLVEPDLERLIRSGLAAGKLCFSSARDSIREAEVLWIAYDTPVDAEGKADIEWVFSRIEHALTGIGTDALVLLSSQLPVGSVARLERTAAALHPGARPPRIACSPENLRLGSAVHDFLHPARIVAGFRGARDREDLSRLLGSITPSLEWMSVESAEMTKHALNGFLAASVAYANEIASICESVGADAAEVERGLKSDQRIGPRAYLAPGGPFAGATLARDLAFLNRASAQHGVATPLLASILASNERQKSWAKNKLRALFQPLSRLTVAVWGLAYKPGTDAVRSSFAMELCEWLIGEGTTVNVHDALVTQLPHPWGDAVRRFDGPVEAAREAQALVITADSPLYRAVTLAELVQRAGRLAVLDANRVLRIALEGAPEVDYFAPGIPARKP
jgi:UDPglucose 6-dehydrogenase